MLTLCILGFVMRSLTIRWRGYAPLKRRAVMNPLRRTASIAASLLIASALAGVGERPAFAQEESQQDLAKKVVNPLTDMVSVPLQFNWLNDVGPDQELRSVI